jgi:hypothetical protein
MDVHFEDMRTGRADNNAVEDDALVVAQAGRLRASDICLDPSSERQTVGGGSGGGIVVVDRPLPLARTSLRTGHPQAREVASPEKGGRAIRAQREGTD